MNVKFEPVTTIFIGSGEEYYPNDYVALEDELGFIDNNLLLDEVIRNNKYEEFLKVSDDIEKLMDFIYDFGEEIGYEKICKTFIKGDEKVLEELSDSTSRKVYAFIKDKYYFTPIIPGSSIKGAIRTAILSYLAKKFDIPKVRTGKDLEAHFFCNNERFDAKKDMLKALFVSDFKPKKYKLKVMRPVNRPYKKNRDNPIPVVIEALIEGEFVGEIRIDENLLNNDPNLRNNPYFKDEKFDISLIKKSLREFFKEIAKIENNRFKANNVKYEDYLIKIGKLAGAGSKSISEHRKIKIRQINKIFDYQLSVWLDVEQNPFGWGKLTFI